MVRREERTTTAVRTVPHHWVGKSIPRVDSMEKALGATRYAGDILRSPPFGSSLEAKDDLTPSSDMILYWQRSRGEGAGA